MAGQRLTRARAAGSHKVPERLRASRLERRRASLQEKYSSATTSKDRLVIAFDYLRGALSRHQPNPQLTNQLTEDLARQLIAVGDQLLTVQAGEPVSIVRRPA